MPGIGQSVAVRQAFAALHVAHAEAEERRVYPQLRRKTDVDAEEAEHGEQEHAEGHEALLAVLECSGTDTQKYEDAVEKLAEVVNHHFSEEERTIPNPVRDYGVGSTRADLGKAFADERNAQIDADCGRLANVRRLVSEARNEGLLEE